MSRTNRIIKYLLQPIGPRTTAKQLRQQLETAQQEIKALEEERRKLHEELHEAAQQRLELEKAVGRLTTSRATSPSKVFRLSHAEFAVLRKKLGAEPVVLSTTTDLQAGFLIGVQRALDFLREDVVIDS